MNADVQLYASSPPGHAFALPAEPAPTQQDLEITWFDAPRRSSRPPFPCSPSQAPPPPPIGDPVADPWFR